MTRRAGVIVYSLMLTAVGCAGGSGSDGPSSTAESNASSLDPDSALQLSKTRLESKLTEGSWFITTGSGAFSEHFAFTFRADHSVAGRIYSDYDDTPVVRKWQLQQSDLPGWFRLSITIDRDPRSDNDSAFYSLPSGSLIRFEQKSGRIRVSGDDSVDDASVFMRHADGEVYDDAWFPRVVD